MKIGLFSFRRSWSSWIWRLRAHYPYNKTHPFPFIPNKLESFQAATPITDVNLILSFDTRNRRMGTHTHTHTSCLWSAFVKNEIGTTGQYDWSSYLTCILHAHPHIFMHILTANRGVPPMRTRPHGSGRPIIFNISLRRLCRKWSQTFRRISTWQFSQKSKQSQTPQPVSQPAD